ncbi:DUF72 domain-containing protein [Pseudomonas koreensis]|uniref:DUF72 domain-containing protein n=1 Tax=Pseudomonas koreensis TaxID=198620 RepID=UPI0021C9AFB5|nr:DUF72 domain-containing protein [Pseudomonas koreensis]MCU0074533.1 DUF72 domain-containing protein [Pseudomonas koreensis]
MNHSRIYIGCAGWSIGRDFAAQFPAQGTHLQRYALKLTGVEVNSSFYRPHRRTTYERWAQSVPRDFRFSVKIPKRITHDLRLAGCEAEVETFLEQCSGLGERLGCLLVQLPPSLAFEQTVTEHFFRMLRERCSEPIVLEPRHESWVNARQLLARYQIAQAAVDPSRISTDRTPQGASVVKYWRLHGSPRIYHSPYGPDYLEALATQLQTVQTESLWCIFDNTANGVALADALALLGLLDSN